MRWRKKRRRKREGQKRGGRGGGEGGEEEEGGEKEEAKLPRLHAWWCCVAQENIELNTPLHLLYRNTNNNYHYDINVLDAKL